MAGRNPGASNPIKVVFPNECSNPEELQRFRDGLQDLRDRIMAQSQRCPTPDEYTELTSSEEEWFRDAEPELDELFKSMSIRGRELVPTFDEQNAWKAFDSVVCDSTAQLLCKMELGPGLINRTPTMDDLDSSTSTANRCGTSNALSISTCFAGEPPMGMSATALSQLNLPFPGIALCGGYALPVGEELDFVTFYSPDEALDYIRTVHEVYVYYLHWLANAIQIAAKLGPIAIFDAGAVIGMPKLEFHRRVFAGISHAPSLAELMNNPVLANEMDFKCASIIARRTKRLLITNEEDSVVGTIWPLPLRSVYVFDDDAADLHMHLHLHRQGLTINDLNTAVLAQGEGSGEWQRVKW
ncbi:hypothetical protein B0H11DRAFT_2256265 [Mycena galericulata]|nr:hypothetical protein B0H11DRAFT_2256265 [Mycena galericulata]